jgi:hypothetical protein
MADLLCLLSNNEDGEPSRADTPEEMKEYSTIINQTRG